MEMLTEDGRLAVQLLPEWVRDPDRADAPLSLTASDGTGLRLTHLSARAHIQDPLALTELTLVFVNPEDRELEGRFAITLPHGAAVSRLAMEIGGQWQEGEVVEKQRARRIYEDFLHRAQDPALMEKAPGNRFSARVYPIPARSTKRIRIAWSQELVSSDSPYVLPLQGLPDLDALSVVITVDSFDGTPPGRFTVEEATHRPEADLVVHLGVADGQVGLRSGDLLLARLKLDLDVPAEPIQALTVLVDTSASQALSLSETVRALCDLTAALTQQGAGGIPLTVLAFDQICRPVYDGPLSGFTGVGFPHAMGASDLEGALRSASCTDRLLLISDGLPTAGATTLDGLSEALAGTGAQRLDVLVAGGIRDEDTPAGLARGILPRDGLVLDIGAEDIVQRVGQATVSGITVDVPGAAWVSPRTLDGVQPGDEVLVYAALPADQAANFRVSGARPEQHIAVASVARPLLARAAAQAHIRHLGQLASADPTQRAELTRQMIEISCAHRVLCEHTALLVLETAEDYARYALDRDALADVLSLDDSGVIVLDGREAVLSPTKEAPPRAASKKKQRAVQRSQNTEPEALFLRDTEEDAPSDGFSDLARGDTAFGGEAFGEEDDDIDEDSFMATEERAAEDLPVLSMSVDAMPEPPRAASISAPAPRTAGRRIVDAVQQAFRGLSGRQPEATEGAAPIPARALPLTGVFADIHDKITAGLVHEAVVEAKDWRAAEPGNVLALLALGRALEATGETAEAARAYGSLIDLYPNRTDLRRAAGERLERLPEGQALAVDTFGVAVRQRPDHPSGHRLLAWAHARLGAWAEAFAALVSGLNANWPEERYPGVRETMRGDLGLIAAAWCKAEPSAEEAIRAQLSEAGGRLPSGPSMRLVLSWETDANDVDLHVYDRSGGHACYSSKEMPSGGRLIADVTTGYGPECFTVERPAAFPYRVQAHYYRRGPMGYGTGTLQIVRLDESGALDISARPFTIMVDGGWIDLGEITR